LQAWLESKLCFALQVKLEFGFADITSRTQVMLGL